MSYEISITRAPYLFSAEEYPISLEEWLAFVEADPSLETSATDYTEWKDWGRVYDTIWLDCPDSENGTSALHWCDYAISCWHADDAIIEKMTEIAAKFRS